MPTQQELNKQLFDEFFKLQPSETVLLELIQQGADINAIDEAGESLLQTAVESCGQGLDIKFVQLLLNFNVNLEHKVEGFNCLFEAMLTSNIALCTMLLKSGINTNCISTTSSESFYDYALLRLGFMEQTEDPSLPQMEAFLELIISYGAKSAFDDN